MKILCFMWSDSTDQCSIIYDDKSISKAVGLTDEQWVKIKSEILNEKDPILIQKNGHLFSKRLKVESDKQRNYRKSQRENGKKGGRPRKSDGLATAKPQGKPKKALQSLSLSSKKDNKPPYIPPKKKRQSEVPEDYQPSENVWKWAKEESIPDPKGELQAFIDDRRSKGVTYLDFDLAFRTWLRNSIKFAGKNQPQTTPRKEKDY